MEACGGGGSDVGASLYDMVLRFFEGEESAAAPWEPSDEERFFASDGEDEEGGGGSSAAFWAEQNQLLQAAMSRSSTAEKRIRAEAEDVLRQSRVAGAVCSCSAGNRGGGTRERCRSCLLRDVAARLRTAGFDSAFCRSKWPRSPDMLPGEHCYVDVVVEQKGGRGDRGPPARVVVELDLRGEFAMARASGEYAALVERLPEVFVGKAERLRTVIKIVCAASKRCTKENKMHLGPWRKLKYMQSKWLGACERVGPPPTLPTAPSTTVVAGAGRPRASQLTYDLHLPAVSVV